VLQSQKKNFKSGALKGHHDFKHFSGFCSRFLAQVFLPFFRKGVLTMPPRTKERYNAKARQSSVGGSSHKKRRKIKPSRAEDDQEGGSNAILIDPKVESARREADRQRREVSFISYTRIARLN
jgi:hypothetical protein